MGESEEARRQYASLHESLDPRMVRAGSGRYLFDLMNAEKINYGPHYSAGVGSGIKGERVQLLLVNKSRGTGARLHTHPNEQFCFVVKGRLAFRVADVEGVAEEGQVVYIPANAQHYTRATETDDVTYLASKDTSYYISGDPVDTSQDGGYYAPGFEPKA